MTASTNTLNLKERIKVLDETIKSKIVKHTNNIDQITVTFNEIERLFRDRGELYGYARLVERDSMDKDSYKIVSGRIGHLEKCNGLIKKDKDYGI